MTTSFWLPQPHNLDWWTKQINIQKVVLIRNQGVGFNDALVSAYKMASLTISPSSKHQGISQQDSDIMMTCMDYHETSLPPHLMIPIAFILFDLVSSIAPNSSSHFTSYLLH